MRKQHLRFLLVVLLVWTATLGSVQPVLAAACPSADCLALISLCSLCSGNPPGLQSVGTCTQGGSVKTLFYFTCSCCCLNQYCVFYY